MQASKGHLPTGAQTEGQVRIEKECKPARALTSWRAQVERQVRTWKQCEPTRGTHKLESPGGETSQDMETIQVLRLQWALIVRLVLRVNWWRVLEEVEVSSIARDDSEWVM